MKQRKQRTTIYKFTCRYCEIEVKSHVGLVWGGRASMKSFGKYDVLAIALDGISYFSDDGSPIEL